MRKKTYEEICEIFESKGYVLLEDVYINGRTKMKCKNKDGYLFSLDLDGIKVADSPNPQLFGIRNPYALDNMKHYIATETKNETVLLSTKHTHHKHKLEFRCGECNEVFSETWNNFRSKKHKVCPQCFKKLSGEGKIAVKRVDTSKYIMQIIENGLYPLFGEIKNTKDKILVQDKDGYMGVTKLYTALNGGSFKRYYAGNPYTITNIRLCCAKNGYDCIIPDQIFKGTKQKIDVICCCGEWFKTAVYHLILERKYRCDKCSGRQSNIEGLAQAYLETNSIKFVREFTYQDCKYIEPLPFDFYLPDYDSLIEVDGIGHYEPVGYNGNKEIAQPVYEGTVRNDGIKNTYCQQNDIPLLRIPYWCFEDSEYQQKIKEFLSIKD